MSIQGADALRVKFGNPANVKEPMKTFLKEGTKIARKDVRGRLPRRSGRARRSVRGKVSLKTFSARIYSPLYYVGFLTRGTKRGIEAGHYFVESAAAIAPQVKELGDRALADIMGRLHR
jgi:hypothetical protein